MRQEDEDLRGKQRARCLWCNNAIRRDSRRDAKYCGTSHRQAAWRFNTAALGPPSTWSPRRLGSPDDALRFAYADPPYPGLAARYYSSHEHYAGEVDHEQLVRRLSAEYDGWALSTSATALASVLSCCPADARVAAWVRGARHGVSYSPLSSWEPVIYWRPRRLDAQVDGTRLDSLVYVSRPRLTDPRRVVGAKPAAFCNWLFLLMGLRHGDDLVSEMLQGLNDHSIKGKPRRLLQLAFDYLSGR